jgi:hypothetical protein
MSDSFLRQPHFFLSGDFTRLLLSLTARVRVRCALAVFGISISVYLYLSVSAFLLSVCYLSEHIVHQLTL